MVLRVSYRLPNATECFYRLSGCTTDRLEGLPAVRKSTSCYTIYRPPKSLQAVRAPKDHQGSTGNQSFIASYRPPVQTFEYLSNDLGEQCGYPKRLNGVKCRFWIPESRCTSSYYWLSSIEWCTYSVLPTYSFVFDSDRLKFTFNCEFAATNRPSQQSETNIKLLSIGLQPNESRSSNTQVEVNRKKIQPNTQVNHKSTQAE